MSEPPRIQCVKNIPFLRRRKGVPRSDGRRGNDLRFTDMWSGANSKPADLLKVPYVPEMVVSDALGSPVG